ncbi:hypothetical protein BUALT_Bualt04G0019000 [Buddleja alternifolia]|uniref:Inositol polyphosphate-related phosphatase domain-containing protein n=1 Tax=Buddleja alternifolia TaxID=168488 RepID=A0AAV6XLW9_9LAMI|nr:hypothetical protein BUALT_Bualt04G0019000 [Buddleja alternifolia]
MSSTAKPNKANDSMITAIGATSGSPITTPENSVKDEKKKKSIIPKIFGSKRNGRESSEEDILQSDGYENEFDKNITSRRNAFMETSSSLRKGFSERYSSAGIESLNLSSFDQSMAPATIVQDIRVFVATWNVGGHAPNHALNLEDFLQVEGSADIYVLGFQEIVPLSAGNVLVLEDNEPASKWLALISHALNKPYHDSITSSDSSLNSKNPSNSSKGHSKSNIFHKPSLKALSKNLREDCDLLKTCNCSWESSVSNRRPRKDRDICLSRFNLCDSSINEFLSMEISLPKRLNYQLVASKQMVGIFLSVWARSELVKEIGHLRISCMGRGIMGYLGNKGCISISMTLHHTSFCFVCSHLASGEKEGDELRRNSDVAEILKGTQFSRICKNPNRRLPERIIDHDRMLWLGDLNYRVGLSYEEAKLLLEDNDWDSLLEKDQLNMEREAGRVFSGWSEGKILFAPTYKYSHNSDSYAGETTKSKKKRRTPAWCDRILWRGKGIEQLSYIRGESRFSDHRPVCAVFAVEVETKNKNNAKFRKGFSCTGTKLEFEECIPQRHSFCEF